MDYKNNVSQGNNEILLDQLKILDALSRDYLSVFIIDMINRSCEIFRFEGGVSAFESDKERKVYPYDALIRQFIRTRVYPSDAEKLLEDMSYESIKAHLEDEDEYASNYRAISGSDIHYYQYKYIKLNLSENDGRVILGLKNIDDYVRAAKERDFLIELSEMDSMTKLLNRGSGERKSANAIHDGNTGMLVIFDIDKFKTVNDTFGHNAGDKVIMAVADSIKKGFRDGDIVFRLGGDEFAAFAMNVDCEDDGSKIIERVFENLDKVKIKEIGERKVSLSVGAVIVGETNNYHFEDLYKQADSAVYTSKETSGNALNFYSNN